MNTARKITLTEKERTKLNVWLQLQPSARVALRAKIILLAADGATNRAIAKQLQVSVTTVSMWRQRFLDRRLAGIEKAVSRGRRGLKIDDAMARWILQRTRERPVDAPHWTTRALAKELGISPSMVHRVWKAFGLDFYQK